MFLLNALAAMFRPKPRGRRSRCLLRHRSPHRPLELEPLEDRSLPSGGISLTPSETAPQLVGEPITWTATVRDAPPGLVYQFSVEDPHAAFHVVRDFSLCCALGTKTTDFRCGFVQISRFSGSGNPILAL